MPPGPVYLGVIRYRVLARRCDLGLNERPTIDDLVPVNLQPAQDLPKRQLGAQGLNLADLRRKRQAMSMSSENWILARVELGTVRTVVRQQVAKCRS